MTRIPPSAAPKLALSRRSRRRLLAFSAAAGGLLFGRGLAAQGIGASAASAASANAAPLPAYDALPRATAAGETAASTEPPRLALLLGNREYPDGEDLPPIHKNVRDLRAALEKRGFKVTEGLDLDLAGLRAAMEGFAATVRAAPADATVFFYFSGHGAQVDAENLLVGARLNPKSRPDTLMKGSLHLISDVIGSLPKRPAGLTIAVVDACRTSLKSAVESSDGLNQVEAPPGCLIAFATGAGKPAIAPADDTRNTFYTASLVKVMASASDEISFSDLFRLVKYDVQQVMLNHPVLLLRQFAQFPFIAENTQVRRRLAPQTAESAAQQARFRGAEDAADWARLEATLWPAEVASVAAEYLLKHPDSRLAGSAQVARQGAAEAAIILRRNDVRLYRSAFQPPADTPADRLTEIYKAGRGDKDAAARLGRSHNRAAESADASRYEGWMQYAAALGNGIASYDLALHYRRVSQPLLASQYESRARELGYTPPPSLDNSRK
jgi:uncharacterized caspase-like protein